MKRYAELQAESLRFEKEVSKAQAGSKIYEGENIDQKVPLKTSTMPDVKAGNNTYRVMAYLEVSGSKQEIKCTYTIPK